jgi:DNA-binding NarL/FixJ family response regulator
VAKRYPDVDVLVLSVRDERLYAQRALAAGAKGYIMKHEATDRVIEAVRRILDGHVYLSDPMRVRLIDSLSSAGVATGVSPVEQLSDRELEVFRLLGTGAATREIADVLHVSPKTVQSYYERIKLRLNLASHTDLIRHAMLWANESQAQ